MELMSADLRLDKRTHLEYLLRGHMMTGQIRRFWSVALSVIGVVLVVATTLVACSAPPEPNLTDQELEPVVLSRLVDMAECPEAMEYVGLLFPPVDFVERHEKLTAWKYVVDRWPAEAKDGFENVEWFDTDFDKHFKSFNRPTWIIYDDGRIVPEGGALLLEADIQKLNRDGRLQ